ncbi:hypothetical protein HYU16_01430 [Candidatus Woesearchaeota archaeon]|nr:hypothetical protein [Candidatus Woesearchaeota archaeon]
MVWADVLHAFYSIDLAFGLVSASVALFIAGYALRGYLLTRNRTSLFFSSAFMLIAAGLFSRVLFDYLVKFELTYNPRFIALQGMTQLQALMLFLSIFLATSGYTFLIALFFKIQSKRVITLLVALVALLTISTSNAYLTAHIIPAVLLAFILTHSAESFIKKRNRNTLLVLASFVTLLVSEVLFLFILKSINFYFIGSTLRVLAYLLLLANMLLVLKK